MVDLQQQRNLQFRPVQRRLTVRANSMSTYVTVRFSAALAQVVGVPRLRVALAPQATVGDLLDQLAAEQPAVAPRLAHLVVAVAGRHVGHTEPLADGQEVVLVMPAAGGSPALSPFGGTIW
jgi:molybdopterin converting factor small subunit